MCGMIVVTVQQALDGMRVQVALPEDANPSMVREAQDRAVDTFRDALHVEQVAMLAARTAGLNTPAG